MFRRMYAPLICFETPETGGGAVAPTPDPVPVPVPVQAVPPAQQAAGDAPWSQDLVGLFPDESVRGQVDQFLRTKVQPHVTHVEQQYAPARELWQDLQGDQSIGTYLAVAQQLYGQDVAQAVAQAFQQHSGPAEAPANEPQQQPPASALTPEQLAAIEYAQAAQAEDHWKRELARIGVPEEDGELFAPFVVAADADVDAALALYQQWQQRSSPVTPPEPQQTPPATLGDAGAQGTIPPTVPPHQSLDTALDSFMSDLRSQQAPASVGQV